MTQWLLRGDFAAELSARVRAGIAPTAEQRADFARQFTALGQGPRNMRIAGDVAEIRIEGVLTPRPDFLMMIFGIANTTYQSIQESLAIAGSDPTIKRASFYVDSPGGTVAGLFETLATIEGFSKPISVRAAQACSAAYALAAAAGAITATNPAAAFGSIGVATAIFVDEHVVDIASTDAPNKRPDVTTAKGQAVVRAELDALHELFAGAIAKGRRTTVATVNKSFGRGGVVLAGEALRLGMIDHGPNLGSGALPATSSTSTAATSGKKVNNKMDIDTLRTQHPETSAAAVAIGRTEERDRVVGHLDLAEASTDLKSAHADIRSGQAITPGIMAKHTAVAMNRVEIAKRQADSDAAGEILGGSARTENDGALDNGDLVCRAMGLAMPAQLGAQR